MIMPAWLMSALTKVLSYLLAITSSGSMTLYDPPSAPEIPDKPDTMQQEITIMSYNVWTNVETLEQRVNGVVKTILSVMPDSVGLQEANDIWRGTLKKELGDHYAVACNVGRVFGVNEGTPIFYLKDKFRLLDQGVFWLSDRPWISSRGWGASLPRIAGWAVLQDKQTGFTYVHFNMHFEHTVDLPRINSARLMADRINAKGLPTVLTGDMNDRPDSTPIEYLEAGGLIDIRGLALETDNGGTFVGSSGIIDYIFANHYLRGASRYWVIRDEYDGRYPSDHFAVAGTLTLAN